jgi:hypothetical protein
MQKRPDGRFAPSKKHFKIWKTKRCKGAKINCLKPAWSPRCHLCRQRYTSPGGYTLIQWYPRFAPELAGRCVVLHRNHRRFLNPVPRPGQTTPALLPGPIQCHLPKLAASTAIGLRRRGATQPVSAGAKVSFIGRLRRTERYWWRPRSPRLRWRNVNTRDLKAPRKIRSAIALCALPTCRFRAWPIALPPDILVARS